MRSSGILMHISSLPSPYGIGTLGEEAKRFVDFLVQSKQTYWQILPVGPTGAGDSPYMSPAAFAGNPDFIDLEYLCNDRLLTREECEEAMTQAREIYIEGLKNEIADLQKKMQSQQEKAQRLQNDLCQLKEAYDLEKVQSQVIETHSLQNEQIQMTEAQSQSRAALDLHEEQSQPREARDLQMQQCQENKELKSQEDYRQHEIEIQEKIEQIHGELQTAQKRIEDLEKEVTECVETVEYRVDYAVADISRKILFQKAYHIFRENLPQDYLEYCKEQGAWLEEYALFMVLKEQFDGAPWKQWPTAYKMHEEETIAQAKIQYRDEMGYYQMLQFLFFCHWRSLKQYANERGIRIIGDIPIYVSADSVDVWAEPEQFQLNEEREMTEVSGCPPDAFSEEGQLWGNPLFDWAYMKQQDYDWWCRRVAHLSHLYDMVRIDHFRGLDAYYAIPAGASNAKIGQWKKGPGLELFQTFERRLGELNILVEDLGLLDDSVRKLVADVGYPGMKVLQFAFDGDSYNPYLPHNYVRNCVVYTGTHDNDTILHWYETASDYAKEHAAKYMHLTNEEGIHWGMMRTAWSSIADTCIVTMQDLLGLCDGVRMNTPSTMVGNWKWRMMEGAYSQELAEKIAGEMRLYGR